LRSDGSVWAWGSNAEGQLGNGTTTDSYTPTQVISLTGIVAIAAGGTHVLALKADGTVWAWGTDGAGELGNPAVPGYYSDVPVQVSGLTGVVAIAAGFEFSLAVDSRGAVWGWGDNVGGQLGTGSTSAYSNVPVAASGLTGVIAVAAGNEHSMALKEDGSVWAWGVNVDGEFGNGTTTNSLVPVQGPALTNVSAIAVGNFHSIALRSDGTVWAWGNDTMNELGNGMICPPPAGASCRSTVPVRVSNLANITAISAGGGIANHSLAIRSDGTLWAWGDNSEGQLGDGTTAGTTVPVQVSGLTNAQAVAGNEENSLAVVGHSALSLAVSAASASVQQSVMITGTGFAAHDAVGLYWDSTATSPLTITSAATGTIQTHVRVPLTTAGRHNLIAVDYTSGALVAAPLRITPRLVVVPYTGPAGSTVRVAGGGFSAGERIQLFWAGSPQPAGVATSNLTGAFYGSTGITLTVPLSTTVGAHLLFGMGQQSHAVGVGVFIVP
jgi:alpha-tubulin suppressor-like RCC1 family protein